MSVDHCPTCPECGDDLVFRGGAIWNWQCPDCKEFFDIPDYDPEPEETEKK
jgi:ribosomal protein L37AE/L43A